MAFHSPSELTCSTSKFKGLIEPQDIIIYDSFRIIFPISVCLATMFATLDHTLTLVRPKAFAKMDLTFSSVI